MPRLSVWSSAPIPSGDGRSSRRGLSPSEARTARRERSCWSSITIRGEVRVVANEEARGLSGARNTGVRHSGGDIIAFLDDDATAHPDWLEILVREFGTPKIDADDFERHVHSGLAAGSEGQPDRAEEQLGSRSASGFELSLTRHLITLFTPPCSGKSVRSPSRICGGWCSFSHST